MTKEQQHYKDKVYELLLSPCEKTRRFGIEMAETMNVDCSSFISSYHAFRSFNRNKQAGDVFRSPPNYSSIQVIAELTQKDRLELINFGMSCHTCFFLRNPYSAWKQQISLAIKYMPKLSRIQYLETARIHFKKGQFNEMISFCKENNLKTSGILPF